MTTTFMNAFHGPFAHAEKKPGIVSSLLECITIVQPASVPIQEMWQLGRETIMYPPA